MASSAEQRAAGEGAQRYFNDSSMQGTRGMWRVESARPLRQGELAIGLDLGYFTASDFLVDGDTNKRTVARGFLAVSPFESLDLAVNWGYYQNDNDKFTQKHLSMAGDPTVVLKYTLAVSKELSLGAGGSVLIPTSASGHSVAADAVSYTGYAAGSYGSGPALVSLNIGYRVDNTRKIFKRDLNASERFAAGISRVNAVNAGLGGRAVFDLGDTVALGPFAELSAAFPSGVGTDRAPIRATLGLKALLIASRRFEVDLAADYRLSGAPSRNDDKLPGIPPWEAFAQVVGHLDFVGEPQSAGPRACDATSACPAGLACVDGFCAVVKEVTKEKEVVKEVVKEVEKQAETFEIAGTVLDATSNDPVVGAVVKLAGYESTPLAVDGTGKFKTFPLPVGEGLLNISVEAPGYKAGSEVVAKSPAGPREVILKIVSIGKDLPGQMRGSLKDARTGRAPKGATLLIPANGMKLKSDKDGTFSAEMKPGRYQLIISAPKYETQTKDIEVRPGEVVILNVDLTPKRR